MGADKALLDVDGTPLLDRVLGRLATVASPLIVAGGAHAYDRPGCIEVPDAVTGRGPLGGLVAALRACPHPLCAVVAVDMPDLDAPLLAALAGMWNGEDAIVPVSSRGPEPLHAVYARSALPVAEALLDGDDVAMRTLLARLRVREVDAVEAAGAAVARRFAGNLNRPEDVTAWRARR